MRNIKFKTFILLLGLIFPVAWCGAVGTNTTDGYSNITVKEAKVQGPPKGSTIQATIDGHWLTVIFTENLGQVSVEITTATGASVGATTKPGGRPSTVVNRNQL